MRSIIIILLTVWSSLLYAAEKLTLADFMNDIRQQLIILERQGDDQPAQIIIKNIHVEMDVIAEKNPDGNTEFYVIEGMVDKKNVVTQKLSFDVELTTNVTSQRVGKRYKSYSTQKNYYDPGYNRLLPGRSRPYYNHQYLPDIHPVILLNEGR